MDVLKAVERGPNILIFIPSHMHNKNPFKQHVNIIFYDEMHTCVHCEEVKSMCSLRYGVVIASELFAYLLFIVEL